MIRNPYQRYQQTQAQTATPQKLALMLYDGGIKFLNIAKQAIEEKNIEQANNYIVRTQDILMEFQNSLDREAGGEIAANLAMLYDFMYRQLLLANVKKDAAIVVQVIGLFRELRDTWAEAMKIAKNGGQQLTERMPQAGADSDFAS